MLTGVVFAYAGDLPQISALDNYNPSTITRVYGADGQGIGDFAVERRLVVGYDDIAPNLRMAIIAAEDGDFNSHFGLSISRIAVTVARDVFEFVTDRIRGRTSRPAGASTLTQQLARIVLPEAVGFYEGEISLERKIREAIVAIQIEKRYTKREILTMFANQMYWGHNAYGVEAASRLYFAKSGQGRDARGSGDARRHHPGQRAAEPVREHGRGGPAAQLHARSHGRRRLHHRSTRRTRPRRRPIVVRGEPRQPPSIAPYFLEEVRKHLETRYGAKRLYESGLSVKTTLDPALQDAANRAVAAGLRRIDKRRGYRRADAQRARREADGAGLQRTIAGRGRSRRATSCRRSSPPSAARRRPAARRLRIGRYQADLTRDSLAAWPRTPIGGVVRGRRSRSRSDSRHSTRPTGQAVVTLEQTPLVEGALVAIDNRRVRSARWSAAGTSAAASSTARCRHTGSSARRSSRSSIRRRSTAASRRRR